MSHVSSYGSYGGQQSGQVRTHHHVSIDLFSTSRTCTNPAGFFLSDRGMVKGMAVALTGDRVTAATDNQARHKVWFV